MPLSNAEIDAVLKVLWHTPAIRFCYEDRALNADATKWRNNGGMFTDFSRYHSQKWKDMMGEDDPTVRGRRISSASMAQARRDFEVSYREPIRTQSRLRRPADDGVMDWCNPSSRLDIVCARRTCGYYTDR
jgi:hypothetical protein